MEEMSISRVTSRHSAPCGLCARATQKRVLGTEGRVLIVCAGCMDKINKRGRSDYHSDRNPETDDLLCHHWTSKYERDCQEPALYYLYHEGYNAPDRSVWCCGNPDHLASLSRDYDDAAGPIEFFDEPLPDPKTDVAMHQRRWSDADKVGITVTKCWNPYIAKIYPLTSNDVPGVWMPTPEIVRRWPPVDERRSR